MRIIAQVLENENYGEEHGNADGNASDYLSCRTCGEFEHCRVFAGFSNVRLVAVYIYIYIRSPAFRSLYV